MLHLRFWGWSKKDLASMEMKVQVKDLCFGELFLSCLRSTFYSSLHVKAIDMNQKVDAAHQTQFAPLITSVSQTRTYSRNDVIRYDGVIKDGKLVITVKLHCLSTLHLIRISEVYKVKAKLIRQPYINIPRHTDHDPLPISSCWWGIGSTTQIWPGEGVPHLILTGGGPQPNLGLGDSLLTSSSWPVLPGEGGSSSFLTSPSWDVFLSHLILPTCPSASRDREPPAPHRINREDKNLRFPKSAFRNCLFVCTVLFWERVTFLFVPQIYQVYIQLTYKGMNFFILFKLSWNGFFIPIPSFNISQHYRTRQLSEKYKFLFFLVLLLPGYQSDNNSSNDEWYQSAGTEWHLRPQMFQL